MIFDPAQLTAIAELPDWVPDLIAKRSHAHEAAPDHVEVDRADSIHRYTERLKREKPLDPDPDSPDYADDKCYELVCYGRDLALSAEKNFELMWEHWARRSGFDEDLLSLKVDSAYRNAQNEMGSKQLTFQFAKQDPNAPREKHLYYPYLPSEQEQWPEPEWLIPGWMERGSAVVIWGQTQTFKSFLTLDIAMHLRAGKPLWGMNYDAKPMEVVYVAGEDAYNLARKRRPAWARYHNLDPQLRIVREMPLVTEMQQLVDGITSAGIKPDVIVLDTTTTMMLGTDFSKADAAGQAILAMNGLRKVFPGCTIIAVHHAGKDASRGEYGSFLFRSQADTSIECEREGDAMCVSFTPHKVKNAEKPIPLMLDAVKAMGSLVFKPRLDEDGNPLKPEKAKPAKSLAQCVGEALKQGEVFFPKFCTTNVLAYKMLELEGLLTNGDADDALVQERTRELNKRAKSLAQYVISLPGLPRQWSWREKSGDPEGSPPVFKFDDI